MTRIVVLLDLIHETLSEGGILSLRDIYYSFGDLFSVQAQSNAAVLDIAATLRTTRRNLHIHAGGDGFVSGLCNLSFPGLDSVDCTRLTEDGYAIPGSLETIEHMTVSTSASCIIGKCLCNL